jgi:hypothetical protein
VPPEELDDPAPFPDEEEFIGALEDELGVVPFEEEDSGTASDDDDNSVPAPLPPSSPEQERVNAKARAKVAAMIVFIVRSPLLGVK